MAGFSGVGAEPSAGPERGDSVEAAIAARVAAGQLGLLDRSHPNILFNAVNAAIVAALFAGRIPAVYLATWVVLTAAVVAARLVVIRRARGATATAAVARRLRHYIIGAGASGAMWGVAPIAVSLLDGSVESLVLLSFCIGGMTAAGLASLAPLRNAYFAFLFSAVGGLALGAIIAPTSWGLDMTIMMVGYVIGMVLTATYFNRAVINTLRLGVENDLLAARLQASGVETAAEVCSKWETVAHLSHELRTPLNAVLGFSDMMKKEIFGPLGSPRYRDYIGHVHEGGQRALDLIETIINVSYAESGRLMLEEAEVDLADLLEKSLATVAPLAAARCVKITTSIGDLPRLRADAAKLGRAIANLLSNAVNYTELGGSVSVGATCHGADGGYELVIADTGIGMTADEIPRALIPFVRLGSPLTHTVEGAGLGLPLAKRLVELHDGTLTIGSRRHVGTTVTVRLPAARRLDIAPTATAEFELPTATAA